MFISKLWSDGLSIAEIATIIRKEHPEIVEEESLDLEIIGLKKVVSEVLRWKPRSATDAQLDFLKEFGLPTRVSLKIHSGDGARKSINRYLSAITLAEAEDYMAQRKRSRPRISVTDELERAIAYAKAKGSAPDEKLFDVWNESRGAGGGGA
jgi:hypothetical protein